MKYPDDVPVLTDGDVTLRAHTKADILRMHEMACDPLTLKWTTVPENYSIADAHDYLRIIAQGWEEKHHRGWAIEYEGKFVGNLDIRGEVTPNIGYALHPDARGKGLAVRAIELAVQRVFTEDGVQAIHWASNVGNEASLRVAHGAGFTLIGTVPQLLNHRGFATDAWIAVRKFGDLPQPKTIWRDAPFLENETVRLRPFRLDDAQRIFEACSDPITTKWLPFLKGYQLKDAFEFLNQSIWDAATGEKTSWAITSPSSDDLLGHVVLKDMNSPGPASGEVGYWMHPDSRGKGLMSQAAELVVNYARSSLNLARITLWAAPDNAASGRVAVKAGFQKIGIEHRAAFLGDGSETDLHAFEIV